MTETPPEKTYATLEQPPADDPHAELRDKVVATLKSCYDPEIPVDIYELGLIYEIGIRDGGHVELKMTLTSPACPVAGSLPGEVEVKVNAIDEVETATVELVWDPPWTMERMSEVARYELNMF